MHTHDPRRRIILRSTLAAGAGLLFGACDSRQENSAAPSPTSTAPMSDAPPPPSPAPESRAEAAPPIKVSKAQVQYQTEPKGEQRCATCAQFEPGTNTCKAVEGDISPSGWCLLWVARSGG